MIKIRLEKLLLFLMLGIVFSCDAPRENPFDPAARNYAQKIHTTIKVNRLFFLNKTVAGALVRCDKLKLVDQTDSRGMLYWQHDPVDSLELITEKEGFFTDTSSFVISQSQNKLMVYLNAKPQLVRSQFISLHNPNFTSIETDVSVSDPDGGNDYTTVRIKLMHGNFEKMLPLTEQVDENTRRYNLNFSIANLPGAVAPAQVPELDFQLIVRNINGDSLIFQPFSVRRVILENIEPLQPSENYIKGDIRFTWNKINVSYEHQYYVKLIRFHGNIGEIGRFGPITSDQDSFVLNDATVLKDLTSGLYLWILQVEDRFGNIGESAALNFHYYKE